MGGVFLLAGLLVAQAGPPLTGFTQSVFGTDFSGDLSVVATLKSSSRDHQRRDTSGFHNSNGILEGEVRCSHLKGSVGDPVSPCPGCYSPGLAGAHHGGHSTGQSIQGIDEQNLQKLHNISGQRETQVVTGLD